MEKFNKIAKLGFENLEINILLTAHWKIVELNRFMVY